MKARQLGSALLITFLLLSFALVVPTQSEVPAYRGSHTTDISFSTWFQGMMLDKQQALHGALNRATWFEEGWNLTSVHYQQGFHRWGMSTYLWGCTQMYELTGTEQWLYEAKWLLDQYLLHEGADSSNQSSWHLYERQPTGSKRWLWHDVKIWMTMQYLNDNGFSYDLTSRLGTLWSKTAIDNATDLAWMYDWGETYTDASYVQNSFSWAVPLFAYLHDAGNGDHTSNMTRLYDSFEDFRLNERYKYKIADGTVSVRYTLVSLLNLLIGYKYMPAIFNLTKIQATIDAYAMNELDGSDEYERNTATAVGIVASTISGLTVPEPFNRTVAWYYDLTANYYQRHWWSERIIFASRYYMDVWTDLILWALSFVPSSSFTVATPADQATSYYHYLSNRLDNQTYYREANNGWLITPIWKANWLDTRLGEYPVIVDMTPTFNTATNLWEDTATYSGNDLTFSISKDGYDWNVSYAGGATEWRLIYAGSWNSYTRWNMIFPNGTVLDLKTVSSGSTIQADTAWALEVGTSSSSGNWVLFNTDNSTLVMTNSSYYMWLTSDVQTFESHLIDEFYVSLDSGAWSHVQAEVAEALTRLKAGEDWSKAEEYATKYEGWVIHSDANVSSYSLTDEQLTFTLTGSGGTDTTYVYTGTRGEPTDVTGVTSSSFNETNRLLTLTTTGSDVIVDWSSSEPQASGLYELKVNVKLDGLPLAGVKVDITGMGGMLTGDIESQTTDSSGMVRWELPYGVYAVRATHGEDVRSMTVWLNKDSPVGFDFGKSPAGKHIGAEIILVPIIILVVAFIVLPKFMRRRG